MALSTVFRRCGTGAILPWMLTMMMLVLPYMVLFASLHPVRGFVQNHRVVRPSSFLLKRSPSVVVPSRTNLDWTHRLASKVSNDVEDGSTNPFRRAVQKFKAQPGTYLLIPCVAAFVGWFTNWLAVQMIFYPIKFRGLPIFRVHEVPLGFLGWQGIVPCKTRPMSEAMVHMVSTQLLSVREVFGRLNPTKVAELLAPEVPKLTNKVLQDLALPLWVPASVFRGMSDSSQAVLKGMNVNFLRGLVKGMQNNIDSVFDLRNCVVDQMMVDRSLLGKLFQKCGSKELDFLTNSGLWFGFLLGVIQMVIALFWDNPWSLSIGGAAVGYATNWLALKWIFEPVNPTRVGPFILQGQFLRRQKEVAREFSNFFANQILTSKQLWKSVLTDPTTTPAFSALFGSHFARFLKRVSGGLLQYTPEPETIEAVTAKALEKLPEHVGVLHEYVDKTLGLQESLRVKMEQMTSEQFERVLHPIFEEDELTLVLAGAVLGFGAGLVQQGIETGQIKLGPMFQRVKTTLSNVLRAVLGRFTNRIQTDKSDEDHPKEHQTTEEADKGDDSACDDDGDSQDDQENNDSNDDNNDSS